MEILKQLGLMLAKVLVKAFDMILNPANKAVGIAAAKIEEQEKKQDTEGLPK